MGLNAIQYGVSALSFLIFFYLLWVGYRKGLLRHFPFFYAFVGWCVVRGISRWIVLSYWGYESNVYYHFYYTLGLLTPLAQLLLLVEIYYRVKTQRDRGHWIVLGVFTLMMAWYSLQVQEASVYRVFNTVALYFQVLFCLLVHVQLQRNRRIYLGRNYSGILSGLSLMIALQSLNYGLKLFHYLPEGYFVTLLQVLGLIPWIAYVVSMRKLDLPRPVEPELAKELAAIESTMRRAVRSVR